MGAEGMAAFGTRFERGDGADPEVFTAVAEVTNISGPEISVDTEDTSSHDSEEGWEDAIATIIRSGEVTLDLNFVPEIHSSLLADIAARQAKNYQIVFPDEVETTWEFRAIPTGLGPVEAPHAGALTATATFKLTGKPAFANGNGDGGGV